MIHHVPARGSCARCGQEALVACTTSSEPCVLLELTTCAVCGMTVIEQSMDLGIELGRLLRGHR